MIARTRRFLLGSTIIVVLGLSVGLLAYYGAPRSASIQGPTELAYVPADAAAVGFVSIRDIMNSEFRQRIQQALPTGEERAEIETQLGIDFERDIDTIVAGFSAHERPETGAVLLVRGRINHGQIEGLALQHGAAVEEYNGKRMLVASDEGEGDFEGGVAFLEGDLVGLGEISALKASIDAAAAGSSVTGNADMMRFVSGIDPLSHAWIVGSFEAMSDYVPDDLPTQIPPVEWVAASARVNGGMNTTIRAEARDAEAGQQLRDAVRGLIALAQLASGEDARLDSIVRSIQVSGVENDVSISFTVPAEIFDIINGLAALQNLAEGH
jgi:hypothetical protein